MGSLNGWGAIAAAILAVECLILNLILLAVAAGLWKGSSWLRGNTSSGLRRADEEMKRARGHLQRAESKVVAPFVRLHGRIEGLRATWQRLRG